MSNNGENDSPDMFNDSEDTFDSKHFHLNVQDDMDNSPVIFDLENYSSQSNQSLSNPSSLSRRLLPPVSPSPEVPLASSSETPPGHANQPELSSSSTSTSKCQSSISDSFDWLGEESQLIQYRSEDEFLLVQGQDMPEVNSNFAGVLSASKEDIGTHETARAILQDEDLKREILKLIFSRTHCEFKDSLKKSQMSKDKLKSDRNYLLSINPSSMCKEFSENSPSAYQLLVQGLIGVSDMESISENKHLKNNISLIYSTLSKLVNRKATGFALVQTAAARDGGLREDSIKLFSKF